MHHEGLEEREKQFQRGNELDKAELMEKELEPDTSSRIVKGKKNNEKVQGEVSDDNIKRRKK